jgi:cyclic beta-1,2-glucan synthetase
MAAARPSPAGSEIAELAAADADCRPFGAESLTPHIRQVIRRLQASYRRLEAGSAANVGAIEWFLDNWFVLSEALRQVGEDLPPRFVRELPRRAAAPDAGVPRAWRLARTLVEESGDFLDLAQAVVLVEAYQQRTPLTIGELWALPALFRLAILEELARCAEECAGLASGSGPETRVAGCVTSLRRIAVHDWKSFVEGLSRIEALLRQDPAGAHARSDFMTRDHNRKTVEEVARWGRADEPAVAQAAIALSRAAAPDSRARHVGYYLMDAGRPVLERQFHSRPPSRVRIQRWVARHATLCFFGGVAGLTLGLLALPAGYLVQAGAGFAMLAGAMILAAVPAIGIAVAAVNWLVTHFLPPRVLARLDFDDAVPRGCRTVVTVPTLLTSPADVDAMLRQLEVNYQGNADAQIVFALLTDRPDAPQREHLDDEQLLAAATAGIDALNRQYASGGDGPFLLLYRGRRWNQAEGCWMGWERKRGKLAEFNRLLLGDHTTDLRVRAGRPDALSGIRYVITLDADTFLPGGAAARLIGTLAHPLNTARMDPSGTVQAGYTVLQPRIEVSGRSAGETAFAAIFEGDGGVDLYTHAVSDAYFDLLGEGIYAGKGIYDVAAFEQSLAGRIPENALLSHDLFEGVHGRAGLVSDVQLLEEYPSHLIGYARRLHRWVRGDWQLLPWLRRRVPLADGTRTTTPLSVIDRWKAADNLRRSLTAPAMLGLFVAGWLWFPGSPWFWTVIAAGTLAVPIPLGAATTANRLVTGAPWRPTVSRAVWSARTEVLRWLLALVFLAFEAAIVLDAVGRTLLRLWVTRRRLLEWQSAALTAREVAQASGAAFVWRRMVASPIFSLGAGAVILATARNSLPAALPFLVAWLLAPQVAYQLSQPRRRARQTPALQDRMRFRRVARRTWHYFEHVLSPDHAWLAPDHYQEWPLATIAHRTSPTNVGMGLLAALAAYDLGYLGLRSAATLLANTMQGLTRLERFHGHFFNWYDTRSGAVLMPRYVSAVDSGNLAAALIALREGCRDLENAPSVSPALWRGLRDTIDVFAESVGPLPISDAATKLRRALAGLVDHVAARPGSPGAQRAALHDMRQRHVPTVEAATAELVETAGQTIPAGRLRDLRLWLDRIRYQTERSLLELDGLAPWAAELDGAPEPVKDALAGFPTLRETADLPRVLAPVITAGDPAWQQRFTPAIAHAAVRAAEVLAQLRGIATQTADLVENMDFAFLYDPHRHLFHIGYDVDAGRLDASYYDLLASEARLTSLVAIAKRDVADRHWLHLGRPFARAGGDRVLLSWGGTMFEYLMPLLLTELPDQALLTRGCQAAVREQQRYARLHGIPWGVSESAFYPLTVEGHYQYRAFGVPGLGLKRGLGDRWVVSPYAALLALPLVPRDVARNLEQLERLGAMGPYGFYEAVDLGSQELGAERRPAIVRAYMSHHQGMILVALANHLAGNAMVRRFHQDPRVASVEYLLYEQVPRQVPIYRPERRPMRAPAPPRARYVPWTVRQSGVPQLHILSNGRYSVLLTATGGGGSRWRGRALTRWRAESGVDQWGHWLYVEDRDTRARWSVAHQPVTDAPAETAVQFSAAAVEYWARAHGIAIRARVTVPVADDLELRRVTLTNESRQRRRLALTSVIEVALARPADDLRHQAFGKLFIESELLPRARAIIWRRRPGGPDPGELFLGHAVVAAANVRIDCSFETDRARFYGPGGAGRPAALTTGTVLAGTAGATLDPLGAIRATLVLDPGEEVSVAFVTAVAVTRDELLERLDSYASWSRVEQAFEEAAVHVEGELSALSVSPDEVRTIQRLFSAVLVPDARLRPGPEVLTAARSVQLALWKFGISGDLPILVIRAAGDRSENVDVIRTALKFHTLLRRRGCEIDLVLLDELSTGYHQPYYERIGVLITEAGSDAWVGRKGGVFVIRARDLALADRRLIESAARAVLDTSRALDSQLASLDEEPARLPAFAPIRPPEPEVAPPPPLPIPAEQLRFDNGLGGFTADGREYVVRIREGSVPPRAWVHVVANPGFGFVVSATGGGFTWALNSAERRLTPWRNDPVIDLPGEVLYLRDEESGTVWSATPSPAGAPEAGPYEVRFGAGYATFTHWSHGITQIVRLGVAPDDPVKLIELTVENTTQRLRRLTATYYVEWVLGSSRHRTGAHLVPEYDAPAGALLARNPFHPSFSDRVAFLAASEQPHGLTADRSDFVGETNDLSRPAALHRIGPAGIVRPGGDACAALQVYIQLEPGERRTVHFVLGDGANRDEALRLVHQYRDAGAVQRAREVTQTRWDGVLEKVQVRTPDPALDLLLNRWLLYQTTACRLWARTGLSQSSGAFGFRDQLQDVLALAPLAPELARAHVLEAARHQFEEGDVLHWWHPGTDAGVRTRCSDDLLWLPFAAAHYVAVTGDGGILDEQIPFLSGEPLDPKEGERYGRYSAGAADSLYTHCQRALDRAVRLGTHGLPLFGTGDWNDGMNRVGAGGRGESVWLAWFIVATLRAFAAVSARRGDTERAALLRARARALVGAVEKTAWDGAWYLRGFYDDGTLLGSTRASECRIDAIAQSWAVISGAAMPERAASAMRSLFRELVDPGLRLARLLDPPFDQGAHDPGYIRAYPPGVRENGGQYTHAAVWTAWASGLLGDGDRVGELLHWLNPINRTATPAGVARYRGEPYVVAGDISTAPLHRGAAGWTWYTGSAAWMYRLGIEILLGLRREGVTLRLDPCIPRGWDGFEASWRTGTTEYRVRVRNPEQVCRGVGAVAMDGRQLAEAVIPLIDDGATHEVEVVLGAAKSTALSTASRIA